MNNLPPRDRTRPALALSATATAVTLLVLTLSAGAQTSGTGASTSPSMPSTASPRPAGALPSTVSPAASPSPALAPSGTVPSSTQTQPAMPSSVVQTPPAAPRSTTPGAPGPRTTTLPGTPQTGAPLTGTAQSGAPTTPSVATPSSMAAPPPPAVPPPAPPGSAATAEGLRGSVEKALQSNPEVSARFNAYRAATDAVDVARGGFFPRVDLDASAGREHERVRDRNPGRQTFSRTGIGLTLRQLLWDGLGTASEVRQFGHDKLARYFDVLEMTEQTALEAARAHYDVLRYRRLVQLAEDNYVQHRYAALQIGSRVQAGVGRGVDSEQVAARQALAESNLTTEVANYHDVVARYQRIVGDSPPPSGPMPTMPPGGISRSPTPPLLSQDLPASESEAVAVAIQRNTAISASIEAMRAARAGVSVRQAAYQPRVEARLRGGAGRNFEGVEDQTRNATAEILLNWNLFAGGSDAARVRQQANLLNQAADLRDKACRDARQVASIAYNDTRRLTQQLEQLQRNTSAIVRARDAYRQQFDTGVGQRTLLDLLNSENEVYTAQRAFANAEYDVGLSYVRTQAALNRLTSTLGLAGPGAADMPEIEGWSPGEDAPRRCPVVVPEIPVTARSALDSRADQLLRTTQPPAAASPVLPPAGPAAAPPAVRSLPPAAPRSSTSGDQRTRRTVPPRSSSSRGSSSTR